MNILQNKYIIPAIFGALCPASIIAQTRSGSDTTFKSQTLNFYSTYKPEVVPAPKPVFVPTLPVVDTSKPVLQYIVPEQTISYTYKAEPIKPVALKRQREKLPFENYAKLGLGSQSTVLIDAGIGSLMGNDYDAVVHFNHLSQKGNQMENQKWSQNTLDASGNIYMDKATLSLGLQGDRRAYRQYGYINELYSFNDADVRNTYSGLAFNAALAPVGSTFWDLKYRPEARIYWWHSNMNASERNLDLSIPVTKAIDSSISFTLAANLGLTNYNSKALGSFTNNYFQLAPSVNFSYEGFKARVGLKPTFASSDNYLLPDINVSGNILDNSLRLYAGWEGALNQNTYRSLSLFNPYMQADYTPRQGRSSYIYGGFDAALSSHLTLGASVGYKMWKNMAMYQNDYTLSPDGRSFAVIYEDIKALIIDAKIQYQINEQFSIVGRSVWNLYSPDSLTRAQQLPQVEVNGGFRWELIPKLHIGADVVIYDRIFARQSTGLYRKLPMIIDLNANASYDVHKRVGLFLNVDNILNQRYQYWNQYKTLGFTIYGGLRFKF